MFSASFPRINSSWNRIGAETYRPDRSNTRKRRGANTGGRARHGTASQPAIDESRLPTGTTLSAGQQMSIALNDSETTMRYASLFPAVVSRTSATMRPISVFVLGKMMDRRRSSSHVTRIFNVSPENRSNSPI